MHSAKLSWRGTLLAVQPRIRLTRSFDERSHSYLGYVLFLRGAEASASPPPWLGAPPALETYRARGHRRLDARTYEAKCRACLWGCRMPVEMILDQWNPQEREHRFETFCYGPKSCSLYRAGPTRKVPGRKGMSWEEEDWIDEEVTAHRGADE